MPLTITNSSQHVPRVVQSSTIVRKSEGQKLYPTAARLHSISVHYPAALSPRCPRLFTLTIGGAHSPWPQWDTSGSLLANSTMVHSSTKIPDFEEDRDAAHSAFISAFESSKPDCIKIPGLQEFAGSIWERRRRIPSQLYNDPLTHLFEEFDLDNDGSLTAVEISQALVSRGVSITPEQVQLFVDVADNNGNRTIEVSEFADLIFHMASADLNRAHHAPTPSSEDDLM